jgi:Diacylglycerol kinase catalytic domain
MWAYVVGLAATVVAVLVWRVRTSSHCGKSSIVVTQDGISVTFLLYNASSGGKQVCVGVLCRLIRERTRIFGESGHCSATHAVYFVFRVVGPQAEDIANGFKAALGSGGEHFQTHPLTADGLRACLEKLRTYVVKHSATVSSPLRNVRLVICGGDGSVAWVVCELEKQGMAGIVPLAIMPVGTGNDLSNFMGWGRTTLGLMGLLGTTRFLMGGWHGVVSVSSAIFAKFR